MIFVRDKGRMCNNILQYAHVYAWGREHRRETVSMRFCYKYPYFHICQTPHHNFLTYLAAKTAATLHLLPIAAFNQSDGSDREAALRLMNTRKNLIVEGWEARFYDLFIKYRSDITRLFAFRPGIASKMEQYIKDTSPADSVRLGLHIRRGDYKTWHGGKYFYNDDVYINHIRQFAKLHPGKPLAVYICGNDPTIDKDLYAQSLPEAKVLFPEGNPGEDLCALSLCDYLMGAPSTFSLVAAMYRDMPLCWLESPEQEITNESFKPFESLFRNIR